MLAGYLPFDDDPANPEGDNINLLYKYIVSTPLTFPEYVTPHARDLLKRILVPDPRKRADLFEVARHSWLSEYAHVVGFITSSTTTSSDIANTTVPPGKLYFTRIFILPRDMNFWCRTQHKPRQANLPHRGSLRGPAACSQCVGSGSKQAAHICRRRWRPDPEAWPYRSNRDAGKAGQTGRQTQNGAGRICCTPHTNSKRRGGFNGDRRSHSTPGSGWRTAHALQVGQSGSGRGASIRWVLFIREQAAPSFSGICATGPGRLAPESRRPALYFRFAVWKRPSHIFSKTVYWRYSRWLFETSLAGQFLRPACGGYCCCY